MAGMTIYKRNGEVRSSFSVIYTGCKRKFELMKEDYILYKFNQAIFWGLADYTIGDYTYWHGERFELTEKPTPTYNLSTGGYEYELQFDASYIKWKNKVFKFTPETGGYEASWSLTADIQVQAERILANLEALGYKHIAEDGTETAYTLVIDASVDTTTAKLMTYDDTNILDACYAIAEEWDCDFWVECSVIHFGRLENETASPWTFEVGTTCETMSRSESSSDYATRIYAFGSEQNLPSDYRMVNNGVVTNGIVNRRLMLPEGTPYLDAREGMTEEEAVEKVVTFEDIYPKRVGVVSEVESEEIPVTDEETGEETGETATIYTFADADDTFYFSKDYVLSEQTLSVIFQTGKLAGMQFELTFNPDGVTEKIDGVWQKAAQRYEIIRNEDYGVYLPNDTLYPESGDEYVLINWDSTKISELGLVASAEQELLAAAQEYLEKLQVDPSTYTCNLMSNWAREKAIELYGDEEYVAEAFKPGTQVYIDNEAFLAEPRKSRIIGYELCLDIPCDTPSIIVGEKSSYSRLSALEATIGSEVIWQGVAISAAKKSAISYSKRGFRDTQQTLSMLESAVEGYSESIMPATIQTLAALIGDESLQFRFVASLTDWSVVTPQFTYDSASAVFSAPATFLQHLTINSTTLSTGGDYSDCPVWQLPAYQSGILTEGTTAYYLYCKCSRTSTTAEWLLSSTSYAMEGDSEYYYFLCGILCSAMTDGTRSFSVLYGFTEILPGRITTDLIKSTDGATYFDLVNSIIAGNIQFLAANGTYAAIQSMLGYINGSKNLLLNSEWYIPNNGAAITKDDTGYAVFKLVNSSSTGETYVNLFGPNSTSNHSAHKVSCSLEGGKRYTISFRSTSASYNDPTTGGGVQIWLISFVDVRYYIEAAEYSPDLFKIDGAVSWKYYATGDKITIEDAEYDIYEFVGTFTLPEDTDEEVWSQEYHLRLDVNQPLSQAYFWNFQVTEGAGFYGWTAPQTAAAAAIAEAVAGSTTITGGMIESNLILAKDAEGNVVGGIAGLTGDENDVFIWGGGDFDTALKQSAGELTDTTSWLPLLITKSGKITMRTSNGWMVLDGSGIKLYGNDIVSDLPRVQISSDDLSILSDIGNYATYSNTTEKSVSYTITRDHNPTSGYILAAAGVNVSADYLALIVPRSRSNSDNNVVTINFDLSGTIYYGISQVTISLEFCIEKEDGTLYYPSGYTEAAKIGNIGTSTSYYTYSGKWRTYTLGVSSGQTSISLTGQTMTLRNVPRGRIMLTAMHLTDAITTTSASSATLTASLKVTFTSVKVTPIYDAVAIGKNGMMYFGDGDSFFKFYRYSSYGSDGLPKYRLQAQADDFEFNGKSMNTTWGL